MKAKKIAVNGLFIALVFLTTYVTRIPGPIPPGYINFGDTVIFICAILMGKRSGLLAGALGSALTDIVAGGLIFAPITLVVKGLEGYIVGSIAASTTEKPFGIRRLVAMIIGALIMVAGYFIAEAFLLGFIDKNFGISAAVSELPLNLIQGGVSAAIGYIIAGLLDRKAVRNLLA